MYHRIKLTVVQKLATKFSKNILIYIYIYMSNFVVFTNVSGNLEVSNTNNVNTAPICNSLPNTNNQLANKEYVDNNGRTGPTGATGANGAAGSAGSTGPTGATGPVAGSNTQIIYNDNGNAGASSNLTYNQSINRLVLTGNISVGGTASNITRRAYGFLQPSNGSAVSSRVTLDVISAYIGLNQKLYVYLTSGTWTAIGWTMNYGTGTTTISNWTNVPISNTSPDIGFAMSDNIVAEGTGAVCNFSDQTTRTSSYRITAILATLDTPSNNYYSITIERLI